MKEKQTWSERINARLREGPGEVFKDGKWRFWFPLVLVLSLVNACLTAMVFNYDSVGAYDALVWIVLAMGTLLCWIAVGALHYSDSVDPRLARGVSLLDSITLCFMIAHFCFLLWASGHLVTLRSGEVDYKAQAEAFNAKAERIAAGNIEIAKSAEKIAEQNTKAERLRNDTAYQQRKAAEAGARIGTARGQAGGIAPSLSTAPVELERPKAPVESSAAFLAYWDKWIRLTNFGELILAAITLIYIRNRSAKFNAQGTPGALFPVATVSHREMTPKAALRRNSAQKATPVATDGREAALTTLREELKVIKEGLPKRFFKADLVERGVSIRLCKKVLGADRTIRETKFNNRIFDDLNRPDFQARLRQRLIDAGFPIGKGGAE